ncbi:hypothetical protein CR513_11579, partial [Mucuna pruriens]
MSLLLFGDVIKDDKQMFELLDNILEEIKKENIILVVMNDASNIVVAKKMLKEKKYSKRKELAKPIVTRFASCYLTLNYIKQQKNALKSMFASKEWTTSPHASRSEAKQVMSLVLSETKQCVIPLVQVLRLVDGDSKPTMSYIYEAIDRVKD